MLTEQTVSQAQHLSSAVMYHGNIALATLEGTPLNKLVKNFPITPNAKAQPIIIFNSCGEYIRLNLSKANNPPVVIATETASKASPN